MSSSVIPSVSKQYFGFDPRSISDCVLWLDGSDSSRITTSGSAVTSVVDKAQNITFTTQGPSSLLTLVNQINGRQALYFNNNTADTVYLRGAFSNLLTGSFFVAWQPVTQISNSYRPLYCWTYTPPANFPVYGYVQNGNNLAPYTTWIGPGTPSNLVVPGTNYVTFYSWSGTTSNVGYNGVTPTTGTLSAYSSSSAGLDIMFETGSKTSGYIGEMIFFNRLLTTGERQQIEGYLGWKWGIQSAFPVANPYTSVRPFSRPFEPNDIDACRLWLDASDRSTFTLSGTSITQWRDKSGNADRTSGGTFNATGGLGNNLSTVTLTSQVTTLNQINISGASPQTYVMVANVLSDTTNAIGIIHWNTSGGGNAFTGSMSMNVYRTSVDTGINQVGNFISITGLSPTKTKLAIATHTGSLASIFESGTIGPTNSNTLNQTNGNLRFGVNAGTAELGELLVYNRALNRAECQQLEGYLANKWKLTSNLPSTHSFRLYPPLSTLFTPLVFPSCNLWYDASDLSTITYASGSTVNVTGVRDKSPSGANLTRFYTSGFEITTANRLNGLPTLYFPNDPVNNNVGRSYLQTTTSVSFSSSVNYIFFVMRFNPYVLEGTNTPRSWGGMYPIVIAVSNGVQGGPGRVGSTWTLAYDTAFVGIGARATVVMSNNSGGPTVGTPFLCMFGKTTTSQYVFSTNGVYESIAGTARSHAGGQPINIGSTFQNQELCELVTYSGTALSVPEIQRMEGYLAWKWGIQGNLPITHPYYKFRP